MSKRYYYITPEDYETAERNGVKPATLYARVRLGWDVDRAVNTKTRAYKGNPGRRNVYREKAIKNGISTNTFHRRVNSGWSPEKASTTPPMTQKEAALKAAKVTRKYPKELLETANKNGINNKVFYWRMQNGWTEHDASTTPVLSSSEVVERARSARFGRCNS